MKIQLITPEQHETILNIYNSFPGLTLQNNGYETIDKSKLTDLDKEKIKEVENILKSHIVGFSSFKNFKLRTNGDIALRFDYDWCAEEDRPTHSFTGVGYILLDELLNGFNNK